MYNVHSIVTIRTQYIVQFILMISGNEYIIYDNHTIFDRMFVTEIILNRWKWKLNWRDMSDAKGVMENLFKEENR